MLSRQRHVVAAEIAEILYTDKPCYFGSAGLINGSYVRVADGDRRLTHYEIQALLERRQQPMYDVEPVGEGSLKDLDRAVVERFLRRIRSRRGRRWEDMDDLQVLKSPRAVAEKDGRLVPTLAGYLCFGIYPQEIFPNLAVTFIRYPTDRAGETGPGNERFLDSAKLTGPIPIMVKEALQIIKRNMRQREIVRGLFREEIWEYPESALREAIVNALGHRDYSPTARGSHVQIQMFPSRLVVRDTGGLFGPVTIDDLGNPGIQASRNQYLMNIFENLPAGDEGEALCEQRGSGIAAMLSTLRKAGMQPPRFDDTLTSFQVTLSNASLIDPETLEWLYNRFAGTGLTESQRLALAYLRQHKAIANQEYCRLTGVDSRLATRELAHLAELGVVERTGTGRWAAYLLLPSPARATSELRKLGRSRATNVKDRVMAALKQLVEASTAELVRTTNASSSAVRGALKALIQEGLIQATTESIKSPTRRYRWTGRP